MADTPTKTYWFHRHPKKTLLVSAAFGSILIIALAEFGARIIFSEWAPANAERAVFWVYDAVLGWAHKPGQHGRFVHKDFSVDVRINSHGLRDDEYSLARTAKKRMLILGDSFGWGFGVEHHERFSEILEEYHQDWEIINASVSGYGTGQQFLYLKERGINYHPDVVFLLFFQNDFRNNIKEAQYWYYKPYFGLTENILELRNIPVPRASIKQKLNRFFLGRTYIYAKMYSTLEAIHSYFTSSNKKPFRDIQKDTRNSHNTSHNQNQEEKYLVTLQLLKEINNLSRKIGAQFIMVSIPMPTKARTLLHDFFKREGVPYLPLDAAFSKIDKKVTLPHDVHWNSSGHEIAATTIERFLQKLGVF